MVTEVYQYRCDRVGQTQLLKKKKLSILLGKHMHELPNHRELKKGIAGIMLGGSTWGLEEMGHKVPLTFSHMAPKKKSMNIVHGGCTGCLKSQSLIYKILENFIFLWHIG